MAHPIPYMPQLFGGNHFVVWGQPLKLPPWVSETTNQKIKENFIKCLVKGTPEQLRYYFKAEEKYVIIQKNIQEAIQNAPYRALMNKIYIAVHIGATIVFFAIGIRSIAKL